MNVKKKYVAIGALASLMIAGGAIGATVTAQSTLAGNSITVTDPTVPEAVIVVAGAPLKANMIAGTNYPEPVGVDAKLTGSIASTDITVTNTGTANATVNILKAFPELNVPTTRGKFVMHFYDGKTLVGWSMLDGTGASGGPTFEVAGGATKTVKAVIFGGADPEGAIPASAVDLNFDIKFDYVTKR